MEYKTESNPDLTYTSFPLGGPKRPGRASDYARLFNTDMHSWHVTGALPDGSRMVQNSTFSALLSRGADGGEKAVLFARFGDGHVRFVRDHLDELAAGFPWFYVTFDGTLPQLTGAARSYDAQCDTVLYCADDDWLRDAISVLGDLLDKGVRVNMLYVRGGNRVTCATPIAVNASKGIVVLDQGSPLQPHGENAISDMAARETAYMF